MRYRVVKPDGTIVKDGLTLGEAVHLMGSRANDLGVQNERLEHTPVYPMFLTTEPGPSDDYRVYESYQAMLEACPRDRLMIKLNRDQHAGQAYIIRDGHNACAVSVPKASDRQLFDLLLRVNGIKEGMGL